MQTDDSMFVPCHCTNESATAVEKARKLSVFTEEKEKAGLVVKIDSDDLNGTHRDEKASAEKIQCTLLATDVALSRGAPVMVIVPEADDESISGDGVRRPLREVL